jgi:hypothetical protein
LKLAKVVTRAVTQIQSFNFETHPTIHQLVALGNTPPQFADDYQPANIGSFPGAILYPADMPLPPGGDFLMSLFNGQNTIRPLDFCCRRKGVVVNATGRYLQITFSNPHPRNPFAIGQSSHFGLGLFVPAEPS